MPVSVRCTAPWKRPWSGDPAGVVAVKSQNGTHSPVSRWRKLLASERDAAALYSRLAEAETGERQQVFRD